MTRDYNKQRRDDARPSSRNQPANRYREEQPPRPALPRLNRETVDRAWEAGAATHHPDYRPRRGNSSDGQPPRDNRRFNRSSEHSSAQNGRRPYVNQIDHNRRFERTADNNSGFRSRSYNSDRDSFDDQRRHNRQGGGQYRGANRRGNDQPGGYPRHYSKSTDRQPREFGRESPAPRGKEGRSREPGRDNRAPRNVERNGRPGASYKPPTRDVQIPRWQSRPTALHGDSPGRRSRANGFAPRKAQFEGDYERFSAPEYLERQEPSQLNGKEPEQSEPHARERHVTNLPDGRVIKGPRPAQRKNAQFWTGVARETENLLQPIATDSTDTETQPLEEPAPVEVSPAVEAEQEKPATARKPRTRAASPVARKKKTDGVVKARSTGPKPSQRGYKWPTS